MNNSDAHVSLLCIRIGLPFMCLAIVLYFQPKTAFVVEHPSTQIPPQQQYLILGSVGSFPSSARASFTSRSVTRRDTMRDAVPINQAVLAPSSRNPFTSSSINDVFVSSCLLFSVHRNYVLRCQRPLNLLASPLRLGQQPSQQPRLSLSLLKCHPLPYRVLHSRQ
jgi:hypothetical protein